MCICPEREKHLKVYNTIIQPSTQQIRNKQINITVLIFVYYVHLLHISIQLDHQADIHKMYTRIELYITNVDSY
jgi:hypothetical protein